MVKKGEITQEERDAVVKFGVKPENDSDAVAEMVAKFTKYYESQGYTVVRLNGQKTGKKYKPGGNEQLFAYKDKPLISRVLNYFGGLLTVDNIHRVQEDIGERKLTFTLKDPVYGGTSLPRPSSATARPISTCCIQIIFSPMFIRICSR